jgi:hypothetical protein
MPTPAAGKVKEVGDMLIGGGAAPTPTTMLLASVVPVLFVTANANVYVSATPVRFFGIATFFEYLFDAHVDLMGSPLRRGVTDSLQVLANLKRPVKVTVPPASLSVVGDADHFEIAGVGVGDAEAGTAANSNAALSAMGTAASNRLPVLPSLVFTSSSLAMSRHGRVALGQE